MFEFLLLVFERFGVFNFAHGRPDGFLLIDSFGCGIAFVVDGHCAPEKHDSYDNDDSNNGSYSHASTSLASWTSRFFQPSRNVGQLLASV